MAALTKTKEDSSKWRASGIKAQKETRKIV